MNEELKDMALLNQDNIVINIVVVDINKPYHPAGTKLVDIPSNQYIEVGFLWDGENFKNQQGQIVFYED